MALKVDRSRWIAPRRSPALASKLGGAALALAGPALLAGCAGPRVEQSAAPQNPELKIIDHAEGENLPGEQLASFQVEGGYPMFEEYLIAPGDTLDIVYHLERKSAENLQDFEITVYHRVSIQFVGASELDETQNVRPDGTVALPYLGSVKVTGHTGPELSRKLEGAYEDILRNPEIYVRIEKFNRRVEQIREDLHTSGRGLSKLINVQPDGYASFPLIGKVKVAQRTVEDVQNELRGKYEDFMAGLNADLFMHEHTGSQMYVVGEVENPGAVQLQRPLNLTQVLARVGGYTRQATLDSTIVFRRHGDQTVAHRFNLEDTERFAARSMDFYLRPDDVLLVPRSKISSAAQLMREIADITFFNGWGFDVDGTDVGVGDSEE